MIDVTLNNFEEEVVTASMTIPVLIDFCSPRSEACESLSPILEKLEATYAGRFKLAKIDADQEPQLGQAFGIRSVPTCILMLNGQPAGAFTDALSEDKVIEFLDKHLPPAAEEAEPLTLEEIDTSPEAVLERLQQAVTADASDEGARFEYVKHLLTLGRDDDAKVAFAAVIAQTSVVRRFWALQCWMNAIDFAAGSTDAAGAKAEFDAKIKANKRDFEARFEQARRLMAGQRWTEALDELLEILMRDKAWQEDAARKTYIAILDIMEQPKPKVADGQIPAEDATLTSYRRRLSSVILS